MAKRSNSANRRKKGSPKVSLHKAEWYFEDCPDLLLELCLEYEFAREPRTQGQISKAPSWIVESGFDLKVPFQRLPEEVRNRLELHCLEVGSAVKAIQHEKLAAEGGIFHSVPDGIRSRLVDFEGAESSRHLRVQSERGLIDFVAFRLEWRYSDAELEEAFKLWLRKYRPEKKRRKNIQDGLKAELRGLGVLRLRRAGLTAEAVLDYMRDNKAALFSTSKDIYRATARARLALERFWKIYP